MGVINNPQEGYDYGRESTANVYAQIIADLQAAEASLPFEYTGVDIGRATKGAAMSLLGKVYLTQKNWNLAAAKLKEVIDQTAFINGPQVKRFAEELKDYTGAGFVIPITGEMMRMPGLPPVPAAERIDIDDNGKIVGLF